MEPRTNPPEAEQELAARRAAVLSESFHWLDKTLRSRGMYAAGHKITHSFQAQTGNHLAAVPRQFGDAWLEVRAQSLACGSHTIHSEDPKQEGFAFRLHSSGIRRLCLMEGITTDEVEALCGVLAADLDAPEHFDSDMVTLLWDADIEHLRYIVAELLGELGDDDDGEKARCRDLMDEIILAATQSCLPDGVEPRRDAKLVRVATAAAAQLRPEQVAAALAIADQAGSVDPNARRGESWLADLREQCQDPMTLLKFVEILHRGVARSREPEPDALSVFGLLLQALVKTARHSDLLSVAHLVRTLDEQPLVGSTAAAQRMLASLSKPELIQGIVRALDLEQTELEPALAVLRLMPAEACGEILRVGVELASTDRRADLAGVLADMAEDCPDILSAHLTATSPVEVQVACHALVAIGSAEAFAALAPLRRHPAPEMRLALLRATQDSSSAAVRNIRLALLEDAHPRVRAEAEQCLAQHRDPELVKRLFRRLVEGSLLDGSFVEKRRVCTLLGASGDDRAVRALTDLVLGGGLLKRQRQLELCAAAAYGLAATGDAAQIATLQSAAGRRLTARVVRAACLEAIALLRGEKTTGSTPVGTGRVVPAVRPTGAPRATRPTRPAGPAIAQPAAAEPPPAARSVSPPGDELQRLLRGYLEEAGTAPPDAAAPQPAEQDEVARMLQRYLEER